MPEIRSLTRQKIVNATIDLGDGDTVQFTFDANKVTPAWVAKTQERIEATDTLSVPKAISEVILEWDITDDGAAYPPTVENIAEFPFPAMGLFFEAVMEAAVPGVAEGNASSPSASEPPSATSQGNLPSSLNGSDGSTSPQPSAAPSVT